MFNNSISISVSDDNSDELTRMRGQVRKKCNKRHGNLAKKELAQRVLKFLLKYWTVLIFLPAAGLLVFEASRIAKKPTLDLQAELTQLNRPSLGVGEGNKPKKKSEGNLNGVDPMTRIVHGVRERK